MFRRVLVLIAVLLVGTMIVVFLPEKNAQAINTGDNPSKVINSENGGDEVFDAQALNQVPLASLPKATLIVVDKAQRRLDVFAEDKLIRSYSMRLGFNPVGNKEKEGDGKTPEGDYVIDWRNPKSQYYKSLHISYPNAADRKRDAHQGLDPGGDIMIHALPNSMNTKGQPLHNYLPKLDWTFGCIAVTNAAMDELWVLVEDGTPIKIKAR